MRTRAVQSQAATALAVLRDVREAVANGRPADVALADLFKRNRHYGSRDRRFFSALVFSWFRWSGWLDRLPATPAQAAAAYALDATEPHPAALVWNPAFEPAGILDLQAKSLAVARWFNLAQPPAWQDLVPAWTEPELLHAGQPGLFHRFVTAVQARPPVWLRCKRGRSAEVLSALRDAGLPARTHTTVPDAIAVEGAIPAAQLQRATDGAFEVQDLASQCVGHFCDAQPGEHWWDVCAGAGGKALHLADVLGDAGSVIATDVRRSALGELARRARASHASNVTIRESQAAGVVPVLPAASQDGILVDAPCSGMGTWNRSPDARWRTSREDLPRLAEQQLAILRQAAPALRAGGRLIYAVCSLARTETANVVQRFLHAEPSFRIAETCDPALPTTQSGGVALVYPDSGPCIGMAMARFIKIQ